MGDLAVPWVIGWLVGHWSLSAWPKSDRQLMVQFLALGLLFELLHQGFGILEFPQHTGPLPPLWLLCLWPLFASTLLHSLKWLFKWPSLGTLLVALGGWGSYLAGAKLTQAQLHWPGSILIAIEWGLIFFLSFKYLVPNAIKKSAS